MSNVRRNSMGSTIRPNSSTLRTIPVDFNFTNPFLDIGLKAERVS